MDDTKSFKAHKEDDTDNAVGSQHHYTTMEHYNTGTSVV